MRYTLAATHEPTTKKLRERIADERYHAELRCRQSTVRRSQVHCEMPAERLRMNIHRSKV